MQSIEPIPIIFEDLFDCIFGAMYGFDHMCDILAYIIHYTIKQVLEEYLGIKKAGTKCRLILLNKFCSFLNLS